jgi:Carboxypeptidase regulatory-like domain/TonB dependent receptor
MRLPTMLVMWIGLLLTNSALPQAGTEGGILGVVLDSSGAVVAGADVTVTNLDTNLKKQAVSDAAGNFEILALPRGPYSVTATFAGFKTWILQRTELTIGERKRITPVLQVGEVSDLVTVDARAELLQTEKGSLETIVEQKQIVELPLNGRNPVELVRLVPGMRFGGQGGPERGITVSGLGNAGGDRGTTEYSVDGLNSNAGMDEGGIAIPNVDTIAEFNVQTVDFSAEYGREPLQVLSVTKSGTNAFHGSLWEFHRNNKFDAKNTFAPTKPKLIRNQFGYTVGGPVLKNKTFFFTSYEGTRIRRETIYNSATVDPAFLEGNFSSGPAIRDPLTGQPFPGNIIPQDRFSRAAKFFFPYILLPNSPGNRFRAVASNPTNIYEVMGRVDHLLTDKQRIYGRYIINNAEQIIPQYKPEFLAQTNSTKQQSAGLNYTYSLTSTTLITIGGNYLRSLNLFDDNQTGKANLTQESGIQGFPTAGREQHIGLPNVTLTNYTGFGLPFGDPGRLWFESRGGKAAVNMLTGFHSINVGYEYASRTTFGRHGSDFSRGGFTFNGQYTGDAVADYLLGLVQSTSRWGPIQTFGMSDSPYHALYVQDFWKITSNLTLNLGVRFDYWGVKRSVRGGTTTFDPELGKVIAGEDPSGKVDLTLQPSGRFVAAATQGLWVPASQAGYRPNIYEPNGYFSPRIGFAWRPKGAQDLVVRAGFGIFTSDYTGNRTASTVNLPFFGRETLTFGTAQRVPWETAWPLDPQSFTVPALNVPSPDINPNKSQQWNVSIQKSLPGESAITVSYVRNRSYDLFGNPRPNEAVPGPHASIQADRPFQALGPIQLFANVGRSWYNAMHVKWERRFSEGFSYMLSYSLEKRIDDFDGVTPYAPADYDRGVIGPGHILAINSIYEIPLGKGKKFLSNAHPVVNVLFGGWQLSGIYSFVNGTPLNFDTTGSRIGNGFNTRANYDLARLKVDDPTADRWFNPDALSAPPLYTFAVSGQGPIRGPSSHVLDISLAKNFFVTERKYVQLRWEMFNMPNRVNLNNPNTVMGNVNAGRILSAQDARSMQFGLKFIF